MDNNNLSEKDIDFRDHCSRCDTWEHGVGFLLYAVQFPTRIDVVNLTNAIELVFPAWHAIDEWNEFQDFLDMREELFPLVDRMDARAQESMNDRLIHDIMAKVKMWLAKGVEEPKRPAAADYRYTKTKPPIDPSKRETATTDTMDQLAIWRQRQRVSVDVQRAKVRIRGRLKKEALQKAEDERRNSA